MNAANTIEATQRLEILYAVNNKLKQVEAEGLHINHVLPQILDIAVKQFNVKDGSIIVVDQDSQIEHAWLADKKSDTHLDDVMANGLAGWVIRNQQPAITLYYYKLRNQLTVLNYLLTKKGVRK